MSQRLIEQLSIDKLSRFREPIGYRRNGQPIFLIGGASPDDGSNTGGDGGGTGSGGTEGGSTGDSGTGGTGSGSGTGSTGDGGNGASGNETISKEEFEALKSRMAAADRRATAAENKVKEFEDKDKDEATKQSERVQTLEAENTELKKELTGLKAKVAFLANTDYTWHDGDTALGQIDLSEIMNDQGEIDGKVLKARIKQLAEAKPFLVKKASDGGGSGTGGSGSGSGGQGGQGQGSSGQPVGSGSGGRQTSATDEALYKKYPALRR